jgi:hypothetical protein
MWWFAIAAVVAVLVLALLGRGGRWLSAADVWYRGWRQDCAERKVIRVAAAFMGKWKVYDAKKAVDNPTGDLQNETFAAKVESVKQKARAQGDPYAFDKAVREMVTGRTDVDRDTQDDTRDKQFIGACADKLHDWNLPED